MSALVTTQAKEFPICELNEMASVFATSGMFGVKDKTQAMALMLIAQAEGRHPATIAQEYDVIQGRPALKSQATLARFQAAGGFINWVKRSDTECSAVLSHPQGGDCEITWTMERATKAGLTGKDNWKKFPAQMLAARVVAEGVRAVFPACLNGLYISEEVMDMEPKKAEPRIPEYSEQPPADATAQQAAQAMHNAQKKEKKAATEEDRPDFVAFLQSAGATLATFEPIIAVIHGFGYDTPEAVAPMDFRPIVNEVKKLLPAK